LFENRAVLAVEGQIRKDKDLQSHRAAASQGPGRRPAAA
jgi:hypothetical protein